SVARPRVADLEARPAEPLSMSTSLSTPAGLSATFSVLVTALLTTAVLGILHAASDTTRGAWVLGLAGACAALGFALSRKRAADHPLHPLAVAYRVQAAALAWLLAIVGHLIAWIITRPSSPASADDDAVHRFQRIAWVNHATAGLAWFTASVTGLPPAGSTLAILLYAWLLLGTDLILPRL